MPVLSGLSVVVLLTNGSLLGTTVRRLLAGREGLRVAVVERNGPNADDEIERARPQVIVLDSAEARPEEDAITRLLQRHSNARVIALSLNHTGMEVYRMQRILQVSPGELLAAVQGRPRRSGARKTKQSEDA